jgi:hypothetical protein
MSRTKYTHEQSVEICDWIASGRTLASYCRERGPNRQTIYNWLVEQPDFRCRLDVARDVGFDNIADEMMEISNTPVSGVEIEESGRGTKIKTRDMIDHRRLQIYTREKLLAVWCPKRYGPRSLTEISGPDGGPVKFTDGERHARIAAMLAIAAQRKADAEGHDIV